MRFPYQTLLLVHLTATLFMVGVIWFVQVVHYPLFGRVGSDAFTRYEADHTRLTTYVVMPPMLVEMGTALLLLAWRPAEAPAWLPWLGVSLLAVIWGSTFLLQVPCHEQLTGGFAQEVHHRLVSSNWVRTVCWTARGVIAVWLVVPALTRQTHG